MALSLWTVGSQELSRNSGHRGRKAGNVQVTGIKQKESGTVCHPIMGKVSAPGQKFLLVGESSNSGINITENSSVAPDKNFLEKDFLALWSICIACTVDSLLSDCLACLPPLRASLLYHPVLLQALLAPGYRSESKCCGGSISIWACAMIIVTWQLSGIISKTFSSFSLILSAQITAWAAFPLNTTCSPFVTV